ncbi:CobW family GTP-binding protein [Streptomyces sp. NPDC006879]|uniref:CobW family GTP-binding protein n=1 Tax=Streptomyces sp. NPDC006879 TaxID=3364767 RepID=UPI0036C08124
MNRKPIPVVLLSGFLGSGKTTLLNHVLRRSRGTRIGVVVNDFGAIEIDAMTVAGQVDSMVSLGNGCLCCAVDASELDAYLDKLAEPAHGIDVIVIEASGLAEPQELVRMLLASENPAIAYGGLVQVVDAAEFEATRGRHPETDRHLSVADLVVLNKTDRVGEKETGRIEEVLEGLAPGVAVIRAVHGRIAPELLFDPVAREDTGQRQLSFEDLLSADEEGHCLHVHEQYQSLVFEASGALSPRRLIDFLDARPAGLYRIKGFVYFGVPGYVEKYAVHAVGRSLRFEPTAWKKSEARGSGLVLIGSGIDAEAVLAGLEGCREGTPQDGHPDSKWGVLRYVPKESQPGGSDLL